MSEFVKVMKDWRRMCQAMDKEYGSTCCAHCPLEKCSAVYDEIDDSRDYAENERQIEAWAAEHPEPFYPTWSEWLVDIGVFPKMMSTIPSKALDAISNGVCKPIPADIAEKLGLQPKEVRP